MQLNGNLRLGQSSQRHEDLSGIQVEKKFRQKNAFAVSSFFVTFVFRCIMKLKVWEMSLMKKVTAVMMPIRTLMMIRVLRGPAIRA